VIKKSYELGALGGLVGNPGKTSLPVSCGVFFPTTIQNPNIQKIKPSTELSFPPPGNLAAKTLVSQVGVVP